MTATRRDWKTGVLALASIAALALLGGCAQSPPIKGQYVLDPPNPPPAASAHPGMLRVGTVGIGAPYRGRAFVFRETDLKYETDFYHEFLVAPVANIGESTARALAAARVFAAVAPSGVVADADWVLEAFVDRLYGDGRVKAKPVAVLSITYFLRRADSGTGLPVWSKTYERQVPFEAASARAYVGALNGAFGEILAELVRDLAALSLPAR